MQLEGKAGLSIAEACQAVRISRSGFYRHFEEHHPRQADRLGIDWGQGIDWGIDWGQTKSSPLDS